VDDATLRAIWERCGRQERTAAREAGLAYGGAFRARIDRIRAKLNESPAPSSAPLPSLPPEAPAWQGYRPRAGWTAPVATERARASREEVRRWAVVTDVHAPFHDRKAWSVALDVIREWKPHRLVNLGDFMDTEAVSRHGKNSPDTVRLAEEYHEANLRLDELQNAAPEASFIALEGNHEGRVAKWCNEFGNMDGMLDVASSLYFTARDEGYHRSSSLLRGGTWVPLTRQPYVIDDVALLHGVFENMHHASFHAIHLVPTTGARCALYGHMHDLQEATAPSGAWAACCGFLGERQSRGFGYTKGRPKPWPTGFRLVESSPGLITTTAVRIVNGRALFGGRVIEARAA
jgi:hypothetical protein